MKITSLFTLLFWVWVYSPSWAKTMPNSGVDDVETPPEGQGTEGDPVGVIDGSVLVLAEGW
jgi:hypothetical protein